MSYSTRMYMHSYTMPTISNSFSFCHRPPLLRCVSLYNASKGKQLGIHLESRVITKPHCLGNIYAHGHDCLLSVVDNDIDEKATVEIRDYVDLIKCMLRSMRDGEISISPYDTAWVALISDIHHSNIPQFPSTIRWIADNQLADGSWGDNHVFLSYDRIINTLACVIALKSWNVHSDKSEKGLSFLKKNVSLLEKESSEEHMLVGFEIVFPVLLDKAKLLGIEIITDDSSYLQHILIKKNQKLAKLPKEILHNVHTTLLHSLEGIPNLDWKNLLKLQCTDGSFLFSPASTALAFIETRDEKCFTYLNNLVHKFNGGVPTVYPYDLFEHNWTVDRLQRLGISRFFQPEIKNCMGYVHRYWTNEGIFCTRNSPVHDVDDTSMGFRLLRLHGYDVSSDAFKPFQKGNEFICYEGQTSQTITVMYNLYRASQLLFPKENILQDAKDFTSKFLSEKRAANQLLDKWIITKNLPGEVAFALDVPWYACLPRVEARFYIEHYGGGDDVWIDKCLFRMPYVNNNDYLKLAKLDYNHCQALHHFEWESLAKWYEECILESGIVLSRRCLRVAYFLAAASMFEPERSMERISWAKTTVLIEMITSYFSNAKSCREQRIAFVNEVLSCLTNGKNATSRSLDINTTTQYNLLSSSLCEFSQDAIEAYGKDITHYLHQSWKKWLLKWQDEGDKWQGKGELIVETIILMGGCNLSESQVIPIYEHLCYLINRLCHHLGHYQLYKNNEQKEKVDEVMRELVQIVLNRTSLHESIDNNIMQTFLTVAKSFYYSTFIDDDTMDNHIVKVLFSSVD